MASIEDMSISELEEFISQIPTKAACDRANKEKLLMFLDDKKLRVLNQQAIGETNGS
jgi:hypothetical protein